jgi:hypothetical protein
MPFDNPHQAPIGDLEILTDARARIDSENSWVKGRFKDGDRHCLVAALSLACGSRSFNIPNKTERRLVRLLVKQLPPDTPFWARIRFAPARQRLMAFNDDSGTSHGNVVALLDQAISDLASKASVAVSL